MNTPETAKTSSSVDAGAVERPPGMFPSVNTISVSARAHNLPGRSTHPITSKGELSVSDMIVFRPRSQQHQPLKRSEFVHNQATIQLTRSWWRLPWQGTQLVLCDRDLRLPITTSLFAYTKLARAINEQTAVIINN